ncbi:ImuA family protein [Elioraea rosea]|uniref:ImuA family protein n=1 Tax=Elioraea rosea TaxID=2492390 RepID=UPI001184890E|nr:hypothetical protein [Elioraea rosea]
MTHAAHETLAALKALLARSNPASGLAAAEPIPFGTASLDGPLGGGLPRAALHEAYAEEGTNDAAAAAGFGLGIALRAAGARSLVWIRQDFVDQEAGRLFGSGLAAFGAEPDRIVLVRVPDQQGAVRAAEEALRCPPLGAVLVEVWGKSRALDLNATRRLGFAAGRSGVPCILVRLAATPAPSAAMTRWSVSAAPSRPLEANAPGRPALALALLRHRAGIPGRTWHVEWDRDRLTFAEPAPLSRPVVSVPAGREAAAGGHAAWRRAG